MKFLLDSVNLEEIRFAEDHFVICGVTSNPSIIKKEGRINLIDRLKAIREIIGLERSLHVQVTGDSAEEMEEEALRIREKVDKELYIKIPSDAEGFRAMKRLRGQGVHVTATAVYTQIQGLMAAACQADYIAPYYNRMEAMGADADAVIGGMRSIMDQNACGTQILAASFKNVGQIDRALRAGAHCVTVQPQLLRDAFAASYIESAVMDFKKDWINLCGSAALGEEAE